MVTLWLIGMALWLMTFVTYGGIRWKRGDFAGHRGDELICQHIFAVCLAGGVLWPLGLCAWAGIWFTNRD